MNKPIFRSIAAACLFALAACNAAPAPDQSPPLAGARIGGPFTLTDQHGKQVSYSDFAGKYRIVYFGYTYCPDVCPTDLLHIGQALKQLEKSDAQLVDRIVPIFITIDPARDTPKVVGEFVSAFSPRIVGLTGTPDQIAKVAKEYAIFYQKGEASEAGGYLMDHSNQAYLMGPEGNPVALLPAEQSAQAVADELRRWVQ